MDTSEQEIRGGFQNRDVGGTLINYNMGPDHGVDFALFARPGSLQVDLSLKSQLQQLLRAFGDLELFVHNGFVFLKGAVASEAERGQAEAIVRDHPDVLRVINVLEARYGK